MAALWRSADGVPHYNFLEPGRTITVEYYFDEINRIYLKPRELLPAPVGRRGTILLYDNAAHTLQITMRKSKARAEVQPHPPYSSDIAPTDQYHLFKHFQKFLAGRTVANQDHAKQRTVHFSTKSGECEESCDRLKWTSPNRQNFPANLIYLS